MATAGPTMRVENACMRSGDRVVCGIDEVGRGAWAGPVTVAAVVAAPERPRTLRGVRDSKDLTPARRDSAATAVRGWALAVGVGHASHHECDEFGMTEALRRAGFRALGRSRSRATNPTGSCSTVPSTSWAWGSGSRRS
ncbi:MAG: hypothetical protein M5U31_00135 [Acidimicrobiia bacterium]|nr:hypothetical protein [Acidimicrobiia bacterium]